MRTLSPGCQVLVLLGHPEAGLPKGSSRVSVLTLLCRRHVKLTYHGLLGDYSRDVASTSVDLKPANRRSANDQIQKSGWETWKSEDRAWLRSRKTPLTEVQPRRVRRGVPPNQSSFAFSTHPFPSPLHPNSLAS